MVSDATVLGMAHAATGARLAAYSRVHTTDVDDAAESIGRIFCPHALDPLRHSWPDFHALHNCATFDGFSVNYVAYGGSVSIDPGCLDRFFLLQMPIRGRAQVRTGGRDIESRPGAVASLLSPTLPTRMIWQDNCAQLILLVDRRQVESRAAALSGKAGGPGRVRTAYRPRHAVRARASIPDRIPRRSRRAWRPGSGSIARHDGHLARVHPRASSHRPAPQSQRCDQSAGAPPPSIAPRIQAGTGQLSRPTPPSRSIWKNCRGRPASESGHCNWASSAISGSLFRKLCWIFASSISTHGF